MTDDQSHDGRRAEDVTPAERAAEFRRLLDKMQRAADALPDETRRGYRRERWPLVTVPEMHADLDAGERLEMLRLLLRDYVGDKSGRRILDEIIETMSQEQEGS